MKKRVADIIMDTLADNGVEQAFCVVGGGAMYLNNALGITKRIKTIFNHHEQACAMAAEGYVRYTRNKPALVCVTTGPGGTNTLTGVMGAYEDSIPMIVVSGQVRYETTIQESGLNLRRRGEQEFNIVDTVKTMTKYVKMVIDPLEIKREVQKAYDIAMSGRRGPVWLDIPLNVQNAMVEESDLLPVLPKPEIIKCSDEEFDEIVSLLKNAKSPCILAGSGVASSGQSDNLIKALETMKIPTVSAAVVCNALSWDHPLYFGTTGGVGSRCGNLVMQNADIILDLGCSLGFKQTTFNQDGFVRNSKIIMLDVNEDEAKKKGLRIHKFVKCDIRYFLEKVIQKKIGIEPDEKWLNHCNMLKKKFDVFEGAVGKPDERVIDYNIWKEYITRSSGNELSVLGSASCVTPGLASGRLRKDQVLFTNINCGSMGSGFPVAMGAAIAAGKPFVLVDGDGSFMMNLQELQTMVFNRIPVKMLLFSNNGYRAISATCRNYFNGTVVGCTPESGVNMPNFEKVFKAFDVPYKACKNNADIPESIDWIIKQPSFCVLEIFQSYDNQKIPVVKSRLNADGSSEPAYLYDMFPFMDREELKKCMYDPEA